LLDEPTANLDPLWQIRLMERLKSEVSKSGQAALVAIHDIDAAGVYPDRLLVMDKGGLVADGEPAAILDSETISRVFGIERVSGRWRPTVSPSADPRSSP